MLESCAFSSTGMSSGLWSRQQREEKTDLELRNNIIRIGKIEEVVIFKH